MICKDISSLSIWFFKTLLKYKGISHFVSTRSGGFSSLPYNSLNLSFNVSDEPQNVLENRKLLSLTLGFSVNSFVTSEQVHSSNVTVVRDKKYNLGATDYESSIKGTDAMIAKTPGVCLMVLQADCVPILFYDPNKKVIGIAHAGWKGTVSKIARNTVNAMNKNYNSKPKDIIAGIGPAIGPCCYEVKLDVVKKVEKSLDNGKEIIIVRDGKYYLDLWKANKIQLINSGIAEENIEIAEICTKCNQSIFFSSRASKNAAGRFGAGIMICD